MWLNTTPHINYLPIVETDQVQAIVVTNLMNRSDWSTTQSGPGNWLFQFRSTCSVVIKVCAMGAPDFQYKFSTMTSNAVSIMTPVLGSYTNYYSNL